MDCKVKFIGRTGESVTLMLEGSVYKFAPATEVVLDASLGKTIENLQDRTLRSKFKVDYVREASSPAPKVVEAEPVKRAPKKKPYAPKRTRQESIV